jgi:hypothetical protein
VECALSTSDRIRISVKDTGDGLPPEKLTQLFQPFNRLGQEAGSEEGTGIGLVGPTAVAWARVHAGAQQRTVLYVEDNPANLILVEDLLARRPDIRLLTARDGTRGIEIARGSRPDVILMDINLPGSAASEQ